MNSDTNIESNIELKSKLRDTSNVKCFSCGEPTTVNFWCDFCHDYMTPLEKKESKN